MEVKEPKSIIEATEGIVLELINDQHATPLFSLVDRNRDHLSDWLPWVSHMQTVGDFSLYIQRCKKQHREGSDYGYVIQAGEALVGRIGIHSIQPQNKTGSIGYWIGKEYEGKGIITKACTALIQTCFSELDLNRLEIKCGTGNNRSAAIPERLGFTKEGILRQAEWVNGSFIDLFLYSLLKEEWKKTPSWQKN